MMGIQTFSLFHARDKTSFSKMVLFGRIWPKSMLLFTKVKNIERDRLDSWKQVTRRIN